MLLDYLNHKSPKKAESEDAYVINKKRKIYGVFDGATPLTSFKDDADHNGAYLAAHLFRERFEQLNGTDELSLVQAVIHANDLLRKKMQDNQIDLNIKHHLWSTCVAVVEIKASIVEYTQLGDSMIVAGFKDGSVQVITKDTVKDISLRAQEKRDRDRQNGLDVPEEETFCSLQNTLVYNRSMANTPEGYAVANGMPEVKDFIQSGTIDRLNLAYLLLMTDGLFFPGKSLESTLENVIKKGLSQYAAELTQYLTKKGLKIDDQTGILLKF